MSELSASPQSAVLAWVASRRRGNLLGFAACYGMLAFGYYLQFVVGLEPCPLCILQRLMLATTGIVFLVAGAHRPASRWAAQLYGALIAVSALTGLGIAVRHVWIQHTPESLRPACGPGLDFLLNTFGPLESLKRILHGSGECGLVDWTLLGFSIPEWTLAAFAVFACWGVYLSFRD